MGNAGPLDTNRVLEFYASERGSEPELQAELNLIGLRKDAVDRFTGHPAIAGVFEPQPERSIEVVAQPDTVVDAITIAARFGCDGMSKRERARPKPGSVTLLACYS